jgi:hypothetical protein
MRYPPVRAKKKKMDIPETDHTSHCMVEWYLIRGTRQVILQLDVLGRFEPFLTILACAKKIEYIQRCGIVADTSPPLDTGKPSNG